MNKLFWMHCFVRAIETGSFSAVARELGIGQPNVSRHISSLEREIGTVLLHRSTRQLVPTSEGLRYYIQARQALEFISQAESDARGMQHPRGLLRVACEAAFANEKLLAKVADFLARFPDIELELVLSDGNVDLVVERIDLAIRTGEVSDSTLQTQTVATSELVYVASRAYLNAHGAPRQPADLLDQQCILYSRQSKDTWSFTSGELQVNGRLRLDTLEAVRRAVLAGLGIGLLPRWMVHEQILGGQAETVLGEYTFTQVPVNVVYPAARLLPRHATVFIEFIQEIFLGTPGVRHMALAA